jgi:hypothetical protein
LQGAVPEAFPSDPSPASTKKRAPRTAPA